MHGKPQLLFRKFLIFIDKKSEHVIKAAPSISGTYTEHSLCACMNDAISCHLQQLALGSGYRLTNIIDSINLSKHPLMG